MGILSTVAEKQSKLGNFRDDEMLLPSCARGAKKRLNLSNAPGEPLRWLDISPCAVRM